MYRITIQDATTKLQAPKITLLRKWAKAALTKQITSAELTIRLVDIDEMTDLNTTYRHKQGPTNVLSFPFSLPHEIKMAVPLLGDIVICTEVVDREAKEQQKSFDAHFAHMIVHGVFHLLGYDHESDQEAKIMETLEINVLKHLGFTNPYKTEDDK